MKQLFLVKYVPIYVVFFFTTACNSSGTDKTTDLSSNISHATTTKADPAKLKAEIQEQETAWAAADNARDVTVLAAFYSDDAVSMANNRPMLIGNGAIKKDIEASLAKKEKGSTLSYDVMDVFGSGDDYVTEVGKTTRKDSAGKITTSGKYMAIWEKRGGKWVCIRDIGNEDAKEK